MVLQPPPKVSVWKQVRRKFESLLARMGFILLPALPHSFLIGLSRLAGNLGYLLARSEQRVALANLDLAMGDSLSPQKKRWIARKSFQSFARTTLEGFSSSRLLHDQPDRFFQYAPGSLELLQDLLSRKKGLIAVTFHYGNWEWLSLAWGLKGHPLTGVAQPIKNPEVERLFRISREQAGHRLVHRNRAAIHLYKTLKRGETIGLLVDLNSSTEEGGGFYDFFGVPALTTRAVGLLSLRSGAPVVCSIASPMEDGRYRVEIGPEITPGVHHSLDEGVDQITRGWLAHCETVIRNKPEHWMWMYKRWKVRPQPEMKNFPFYSFHDPKQPPPRMLAATRQI